MNKIETYDHTMFGHARVTTPTLPRPLVGNMERLPHRSNFLATPLYLWGATMQNPTTEIYM